MLFFSNNLPNILFLDLFLRLSHLFRACLSCKLKYNIDMACSSSESGMLVWKIILIKLLECFTPSLSLRKPHQQREHRGRLFCTWQQWLSAEEMIPGVKLDFRAKIYKMTHISIFVYWLSCVYVLVLLELEQEQRVGESLIKVQSALVLSSSNSKALLASWTGGESLCSTQWTCAWEGCLKSKK